MRRLVLLVALLATLPAQAQDDPPLDSLKKQLEALSDEARGSVLDLFFDFGPLLETFGATLGDLANYEAPVILPNGDILIRRKSTAPQLPDPPPPGIEEGSTDL